MSPRGKALLRAATIVIVCATGPTYAYTVATFADPAVDGSTPMFTGDGTTMTVTGGWPDSRLGLTLQFPHSGNTFNNAWFTMTPLTFGAPGMFGAPTSPGTIKFFADGQSEASTPLLQIDFEAAYVGALSLAAADVLASSLTFSGSEVAAGLTDRTFAFAWANPVELAPGIVTFTSAFTSSAVPEPATITLLGVAGLALRRTRRG